MSARGGSGGRGGAGGRGDGAGDAGGAGGGRVWLAAGGAVLALGLLLLGWAVRERGRKQRAAAAAEHAQNEAGGGGGRGDRVETRPVGGPLPGVTEAPAMPGGAASAPALVPGGGTLDPGSRPAEPGLASPGAAPGPPAGPGGTPLQPPSGPDDQAGVVSPGAPNAPPAAMPPAEDRASRVRLTLALRDQLAELSRLQASGDDKLAGALDETRARLAEMESWVRQQAVSAAEWAAARSELERLRKQPVEPPPRP